MMERISSLKKKKNILNGVKVLVSSFIALIIMLPLIITFFAAVKDSAGIANTSPLLPPVPENFTLDNIREVLANRLLPYAVRNTFVIASVSILFNVIMGAVTAYILERFEFRFKKLIYMLFFAGMMVPTCITEISRFKIVQGLGLYNTLGAPILIYIASDLMQLYIYRQFIAKLPVSLDESALLDGCSYFKLFRKIIFPLLAPATATLVIIKTVGIINDMYVPYLYMPKSKLKTMTTFLMAYANAESGSWQKLAAAVIIILIPTLLIYILFQRKIMEGMAAGAVKE
ncbi:carbohydrate ABC transporter permease [Faecalicatena contorta]|uniref:carbohydrate ABC transporter permease n=1 Tax=Faecalicatena contorta TaxID=39482 RepID=UPI001FAADF02|nr:carbohydrate ABC transporter permease [Faecalicatena contorta]